VISFEQFLLDAASRGEAVNTLFERRLFGLIGMLHRITDTLNSAGIPHEVVGGLAVLIYVEEANPEHTALTPNVDLVVRRSDLERIKEAAAKDGFRFDQGAKGDRLIHGSDERAAFAVRLVFSGERITPTQEACNPPVEPVVKVVHEKEVLVIPIADLIRMKLISNRLVDQVHVKTMDVVGLVTPDVDKTLTPELAARLKHIRETE
jgi:hypothetical protein